MQKNITNKKLGDYKIFLPDLSTQTRISSILDKFTELEKELEKELLLINTLYKASISRCVNRYEQHSKIRYKDIVDYIQPTPYIVKNDNYIESGTPVLTAGKTFVLGFTNETEGVFQADEENPVIIFDDFTTSFHYVDFNFKVKSSALKILKVKTKENIKNATKYIYITMINQRYRVFRHQRHWIRYYSELLHPKLNNVEINELVDHLSKMETLISNQNYGIPKEIELNQQRYEYYRNKLLTFE